jgi:hypothetical protein
MSLDSQSLVRNTRPHQRRSLVAISLASALAWAASSHAATLCVDQKGAPGCVKTIAAAVTAAAPGDTIQVNPGFYHEDIVITQSLSLVGQGPSSTIIDASGLSNGVFIDGYDNAGLSQVIVTGFTIQNANFEGVLVQNVLDATIFGNVVRSNDQSLQSSISDCPGLPSFETNEGSDCGQGIHLMGVDHSTVSFNDVEQNAGGILVSDETDTSHDNVITRNFVMNNTYNGGITLASHPVYLTTGNTKLAFGVYDNTVSNNDSIHNGFGGGAGGAGIGLYAPGAGNRVYANSIVGNRLIGNSLSGIAVHNNANFSSSAAPPNPDVNDNTIAGNYIAGNGPDPVASTNVPTGISIFGLTPVVDLVVEDNVIEDEGIDVAMNSASTLNLHLNALTGNSVGVANLNSSGQVNARENWWGCSGGPGAQGCSTISGDPKSVVYTPWLGWSNSWANRHDHDHDNDCDHDVDDDHDHDGWGNQNNSGGNQNNGGHW